MDRYGHDERILLELPVRRLLNHSHSWPSSVSGRDGSTLVELMPNLLFFSIGSFLIVVFLVGLLENGIVLVTFALNKRLRTINTSFLVGLSLGNLLQVIFTLPQVIVSSFSEGWESGHSGCVYNAFTTTMLGLSQIALLTVIAVERYLIIVRQVTFASKSFKSAIVTMVLCFLYGTCWAVGPLVGWSRFELETGGMSCSVSWEMKDTKNLSYSMCLFTFVWFIPLILIAYSYFQIIYLLRKERTRRRILVKRDSERKSRSKEWKVAVTVLLMVGAFVISWTPYSVVSLWSVFGDVSSIPMGAILTPAIIAKSSVVWNPVVYFCRHKEFREACLNTLCCRSSNNSSVEVTHVNNSGNKSKSTKRSSTLISKRTPSRESIGDQTEAEFVFPEKHASEMVMLNDYVHSKIIDERDISEQNGWLGKSASDHYV